MIIDKINFRNPTLYRFLIAEQSDQPIAFIAEFHFSNILHNFFTLPFDLDIDRAETHRHSLLLFLAIFDSRRFKIFSAFRMDST